MSFVFAIMYLFSPPLFILLPEMLNQDEDEELGMAASHRRNMRSLSGESQNATTQTPRPAYSSAASTVSGSSPVKITISKSPQGRPATVHSGSQPPKVCHPDWYLKFLCYVLMLLFNAG